MKYFYIVYTIEENGKLMAGVERLLENDNIVNASKRWKFANICSTKKWAEAVSEMWNQGYLDQGIHVYQEQLVARRAD